jgi:transposase
LAWIARQTFAQPAQQYVLSDALAAVQVATLRVRKLTEQLRQFVQSWHQAQLVKALRAMPGVELVTAVTLAAEVGDFGRFATATDFMGCVGSVPSEQTPGEHRRQGPITKTGNAHLRHVLIESAWHYQRQPGISKALRLRSMGVAPQVCAIVWKAQKRLHHRLQRLIGRGKHPGEAVTAVARELAGLVWAIAREKKLLAS